MILKRRSLTALRRTAAMGLTLLAAAVVPSSVNAQDAVEETSIGAPNEATDDSPSAVDEPTAEAIGDDAAAPDTDGSAVDDAAAPDERAEEEDEGDGALSFHLTLIGDTTFSTTSTTGVRYRGQNYSGVPSTDKHYDDDFLSFQQRFDLALTADSLRLEARLDGFQPVFFDDGASLTQACGVDDADLCYLSNN